MAAISAALLSGFLLCFPLFLQSLAYATDVPATRESATSTTPQKGRCGGYSKCRKNFLTCPLACPEFNPADEMQPYCLLDCSDKCVAVCEYPATTPNCTKTGSVCKDPRFVGGDGILFYFHGKANQEFCLVSDRNLHINAHFIGHRPKGRLRDFTWVQALGVMFDNHNFSVAAKKVAAWDDNVDQLVFSYDGQDFTIPAGATSTWASPDNLVRVKRVSDTNNVHITIDGVMAVSTKVVPITNNDDKVHNYQIPKDDSFAHLDVQFWFDKFSTSVDGVLGQTYQPEFKNPVKVGVSMPIMGGDDKFRASSLFATDCKASKFALTSHAIDSGMIEMMGAKCTSTSTAGGMICRR